MGELQTFANLGKGVTIDQIARIQFYQFNQTVEEDGEETKISKDVKWIPAVYCKDKYADHIAQNPDDEFAQRLVGQGEWICPDIESISVWRYPYFEQSLSGINFVMVVNECEVAKSLPE